VRADRLVATLLLLQARGRVTAAEVAEELEVSERTARRDLDALATAGIPLYSQQGRGGGWSLVGGARTDLSGLTANEARALFLVAGPSSGATPEVKAALRKLVHALPEPFRADAETAATAVVIDPATWGRDAPPAGRRPQHLDPLQQAVVDGVQVRLGYAGRDKPAGERVVHPLGLVAKGPVWYLVADTDAGLRTFRVGRVTSVVPTGEPVVRPDGFDLAETWRRVVEEVDRKRAPLEVEARCDAGLLGALRGVLGTRLLIDDAEPDADGRVAITIAAHHVHAAAGELGGFGDQVEVIGPPEVRRRLAEIGAQLVARYAG
jgi:predicted DNA-binding transcriptional regulator YafY